MLSVSNSGDPTKAEAIGNQAPTQSLDCILGTKALDIAVIFPST